MVMKIKSPAAGMSSNPILIEKINAMCLTAFPHAPETATLCAAAMRACVDDLKPRPVSVDDAASRLALLLEKVIRTHAGTLRDFVMDEQVNGTTETAGLVDTNRFRPTMEEVNAAAGMVARNMESRAIGAGEKVIDILRKV